MTKSSVRGRPRSIAPPIRWFGGKGRNFRWILSHFPEHQVYVEPFGGAASVLLNKPPSQCDVYNDLDARLVALYDVLRDPRKSKRLEALLKQTLYHEAEFHRAWEDELPKAEVLRARAIIIRLRWSFGGCGCRGTKPGFGFSKTRSQAFDFMSTVAKLPMVTERLRHVTIMSRDALDVIRKFDTPETLHYCDPPYVHAARAAKRDYMHEMDDRQHEDLAELLNTVKGKVALSGYPSHAYSRLYKGWRVVKKEQALSVCRAKGQTRTECLWLNF